MEKQTENARGKGSAVVCSWPRKHDVRQRNIAAVMMRGPHHIQGGGNSRSDFSPQTWESVGPALFRHGCDLQTSNRKTSRPEHDPCLALTSNLPGLAPYGHRPCRECRSRAHPARAKSLKICGLLPRNWDYCTVKEFPAL